jgi:Homeodomain-like domain
VLTNRLRRRIGGWLADHETDVVTHQVVAAAKERMDIISAYQQLGSYRAAADLCGITHKTVARIVEKFEAGDAPPPRVERAHNYDAVAGLVAERVEKSQGRMSAKRMLPITRAAGYEGMSNTSSGTCLSLGSSSVANTSAGRHRVVPCTRIPGNSPHNPTRTVLTTAELAAIAQVSPPLITANC